MKQRNFFNLQSIIALVAFLLYSGVAFIDLTTGEYFEIMQYPRLNLDFLKLMLAYADAIANQAVLVMLFLYFGMSANDENRAKSLFAIAILIIFIVGNPISSTPYMLINVLRAPLWIGANVLLLAYAFGKVKSRVFPIIGSGAIAFCCLLSAIERLELLHAFKMLPFVLVFGVAIARFATLAVSAKRQEGLQINAEEIASGAWHCECGRDMTSNFCTYCGRKRP